MQQPERVYYINNIENDVYRLDYEGFTRDTGEKRCMLKNLTDGKRWDIAYKDLFEIRCTDGTIMNVWDRMPDGWFPKKEEQSYNGYVDDPRKEVQDGYNVYGVPQETSRMPAINRFNRERAGFKR